MIIYAVNVNIGGGKVLLDRLLVQNPFEHSTAAFLDIRYSPPREFHGIKKFFTKCDRLFAEKKLHEEIKQNLSHKSVLFFGNIPPFFKPKITSYLYLQNCYLTGQVPFPTDSIREFLRNWIESWMLKLFYKNIDEIWVQTEWMKTVTLKQCPTANVKIQPFLPLMPQPIPRLHKTYKFTYVGSLSSNKGLSIFLKALKDRDPTLSKKENVCIVLNNRPSKSSEFSDFAKSLCNIELCVKYMASREELFNIYEASEFLVATSLYESFYLPLYEASHFGCKLIVPENVGYTQNLNLKNVSYFKLPDLVLNDF